MSKYVPDEVQSEIEESGLAWGVEVGSKHAKLRIEGKLAAVLPRGGKARSSEKYKRAMLNTRSNVRKLITQIKENQHR